MKCPQCKNEVAMLYHISSGRACLTCKMVADASASAPVGSLPEQSKPIIKLSQTPEVAQKVKPSVVPVTEPSAASTTTSVVPSNLKPTTKPSAKKTYPCRWCGHERPTRSYCPACGRLSNNWSAARAKGAAPTVKRDLSHMDVLLAIERRLINEIEFFAREGLNETFNEAIAGFKQVVHRNAME